MVLFTCCDRTDRCGLEGKTGEVVRGKGGRDSTRNGGGGGYGDGGGEGCIVLGPDKELEVKEVIDEVEMIDLGEVKELV